jgi:hypothetical protein
LVKVMWDVQCAGFIWSSGRAISRLKWLITEGRINPHSKLRPILDVAWLNSQQVAYRTLVLVENGRKRHTTFSYAAGCTRLVLGSWKLEIRNAKALSFTRSRYLNRRESHIHII